MVQEDRKTLYWAQYANINADGWVCVKAQRNPVH